MPRRTPRLAMALLAVLLPLPLGTQVDPGGAEGITVRGIVSATQTLAALLRYRVGRYSAGLEWYRVVTDHRLPAGVETTVTGNQLALSVRYDF